MFGLVERIATKMAAQMDELYRNWRNLSAASQTGAGKVVQEATSKTNRNDPLSFSR